MDHIYGHQLHNQFKVLLFFPDPVLFLLPTVYYLNTSNAGSNLSSNTTCCNCTVATVRIKQNVTDALFTARVFLPGLFEKNVFLILNLILPLVDFSTDAINAGNGLHRNIDHELKIKRIR